MKVPILIASLSVLILLSRTAVGQQEYTAKDSATFQQSLAKSHSDAERINYELELAEYSIRKRGSFKEDLDNARMMISRAKELNEKVKSREAEGHILLEEGYLTQEYGSSPEGKEMITEAIGLLKNASDRCLLATAYKALGFYYDTDNPQELPKKIELYKQSAMLFKQGGDMMKAAAVNQHLAEFYEDESNYPLAVDAIHEGLAIYDSIHYPKVQGLYDLLGSIYIDQGDYNNALKYDLQALKISNQLQDSTMQFCETNNHLGLIYYQLDQVKEAIPYFKTALLIARNHNDIGGNLFLITNLANCYILLHEPKEALNLLDANAGSFANLDDTRKLILDDCYIGVLIKLHQLTRAAPIAEEILRLSNPAHMGKYYLTNAYITLESYYFEIKDYSQESALLIKEQKMADEMGNPSDKAVNLGLWVRMDSAKKDYKNAFIHLLAYKTLEDSLFNEKKSNQIAQMRVQYETQQKEDDIRLKSQDIQLLTQNAKLDQAQLKSARLSRNMFLGGILLFVLIAGMQYRRFHEKQKVNLLITDKNSALEKLVEEKEWLLKEVHHRVKNNLHTIICLLESQATFLQNDALAAIESSQHRIYAMSLIHQKLYQSTEVRTIDMSVYLQEFVLYLRESFGSPGHIHFQQEIEPIALDISRAIPLALIINEAVTNSIKYAFPGDRPGVISIRLIKDDESIRLTIQDNGIGMPGDIASKEVNSLGLILIKGLTDDLKGNVQFVVENGTSVIVSFRKNPFSSLS